MEDTPWLVKIWQESGGDEKKFRLLVRKYHQQAANEIIEGSESIKNWEKKNFEDASTKFRRLTGKETKSS